MAKRVEVKIVTGKNGEKSLQFKIPYSIRKRLAPPSPQNKKLGAAGGQARAKNLSKAALSAIGKAAAAKRWAKKEGK